MTEKITIPRTGNKTNSIMEESNCMKGPVLSLNEYQKRALSTCTPSSNNFAYMALNLVGEVGELASKVAKAIRKEQIAIEGGNLKINPAMKGEEAVVWFNEFSEAIKLEAGDIIWQFSGLCHVLGMDLQSVAEANLAKLDARKSAGTIVGDGGGIQGAGRTV